MPDGGRKLRCVSADRAIRAFERLGYEVARVRGSHYILKHPQRPVISIMTKAIEYTVIVHEAEEGGYWTEVAGLPGAGSQGESVDDAIEHTKESIQLVIETMRESGETVPVPREIVVKVTVAA